MQLMVHVTRQKQQIWFYLENPLMAGMHGAPLQGNFPYTFGNSLNESNLLLHVNFCYAVILLTYAYPCGSLLVV